jgi:molybdopterin molybdotransferase
MISLEEARALVCGAVTPTEVERVELLDAVGRVAAADLASDIDVAPFAHSAMDGFALRAAEIAAATGDDPVRLRVIGEIGAGDVFEGAIGADECVRIMTGACLPADADAVVKYEIVGVEEGDGKTGSLVSFAAPAKVGANVRAAGEEARAGEVVVREGEVIGAAGVGFLAGCGVLEVPVRRRPRVAVIATGSELVPPSEVPGPGKIRNSNSFAMAACAQRAGAVPHILPIVEDTFPPSRN